MKRDTEDLLKILRVIAIATDNLQKRDCKIADVVCIIKNLKSNLEFVMRNNDEIKQICEKRFRYIVKMPHIAAFILSPTHINSLIRTCKLLPCEREIGMEFIKDTFPSLLPIAMKFSGNLYPFEKSSSFMYAGNMGSISDAEWWTIMQKTYPGDITEDQLNCILSLMTANASSANLERTFSKFGLIHSEVRNRLGTEKASQLVYLHHKLNQK